MQGGQVQQFEWVSHEFEDRGHATKKSTTHANKLQESSRETPQESFAFVTFAPNESRAEREKRIHVIRKQAAVHFFGNAHGSTARPTKTKARPIGPFERCLTIDTNLELPVRRIRAQSEFQNEKADRKNVQHPPKSRGHGKGSLVRQCNDDLHQFVIVGPTSFLGASQTDPFDASGIENRPVVERAIYFLRSWQWNNMQYSGINGWGRLQGHEHSFDAVIEEQNPVSLIARYHWAAFIRNYVGVNQDRADETQLQALAAKAIRRALEEDASNPTVIVAIWQQASLASFVGRPAEAFMHANGARSLIEAKGGILKFPIAIRRIFMWCDSYVNITYNLPFTWNPDVIKCDEALPRDLIGTARIFVNRTLARLPRCICLPDDILFDLHVLSLVHSRGKQGYINNSAVIGLFHRRYAERRILKPSKDVTGFTQEQVVSYTFNITTWFLMRNFSMIQWPPGSLDLKLFTQLSKVLHLENPASIAMWKDIGHLDYLLWVLSTTFEAHPMSLPGRERWYRPIYDVATALDIGPSEFEETIRDFPRCQIKYIAGSCEEKYEAWLKENDSATS